MLTAYHYFLLTGKKGGGLCCYSYEHAEDQTKERNIDATISCVGLAAT